MSRPNITVEDSAVEDKHAAFKNQVEPVLTGNAESKLHNEL